MAGLSYPSELDHPTYLAAAVLTNGNRVIVAVIAAVALAALVVAGILVRQVLAAGEGTDSMKKIAEAVQEGAKAYLARQLRTLGVFAVVVFFLLLLLPADDWNQRAGRSVFFLIGAVFSAATGYIGMWLAVRSNVRVAAAAREATPGEGEPEKDLTTVSHTAMKIAFRTGGVVGMFTVGLGLLGASCVVLVYAADAPKVLEGFGLGAALIAMFMRVGGGIFTKAADGGADLVVRDAFAGDGTPPHLATAEFTREVARVLRPGGRAVVALCDRLRDDSASGTRNAWGQWAWNATDARLLMEKAGFTDVTSSVLGRPASQLVQGVRVA